MPRGRARAARTADEAVGLLGDYMNLVRGLGLDPHDGATRTAMQPVVDAFRDPRLRGHFAESAARYHNALMRYCQESVRASPFASGIASLRGQTGRMLERMRSGYEATRTFYDGARSERYNRHPEEFLDAFFGVQQSLARYHADAEGFAQQINENRELSRRGLSIAASAPAIPFGFGIPAMAAINGLTTATISAGTGHSPRAVAGHGLQAAVSTVMLRNLLPQAGPLMQRLLTEVD